MANFWFSKYISVSNGFSSVLGNFARFCRFNLLNSNPAEPQVVLQKKLTNRAAAKFQ